MITKISILSLLFVLAACSSTSPKISTNDEKAVPKDVYQRVLPAIYEVVVPKPDESGVVYERPLPVDRLPYRIRNDKYISIGTAFATGENEFVSAAHVFPIYLKSFASEFFLRDQDGGVYPVDKILSYSTYRDLIRFSLKKVPANHPILSIATHASSMGDSVLVIGNAQGEGISLRSGQISSFTPEEVDNQWKFIRFSAPASPGNSGGPLLTEQGEVIGVVTRKNASENLNYAVPIAEFKKLSADKAEFILRDQKITRANVSEVKNWNFETSLPERLSTVAEKAEKSLHSMFESAAEELFVDKEHRFFPTNPKFQEYARHQHTQSGIGALVQSANEGEWHTNFYKLRSDRIAEKESVEWHQSKNSYIFFVSRPQKVALSEFVSNPALQFEQANKVLGISRSYMREKIRIISLGKPSETAQWTDDVGRPWIEGLWIVPSMDAVFLQNCSATPRGAVCLLHVLQKETLSLGIRDFIKKGLDETVWSYFGIEKEWADFLSLKASLLPDSFKKASVEMKDGKLSIEMDGRTLISDAKDLSEKTEITVRTRYTPELKPRVEVASIEVRPSRNREVFYSQHWLYKPLEKSSENVAEFWDSVKNSKLKFDGKVHKDGRWSGVYLQGTNDKRLGVPYYSYVHCTHGPDVPDDQLPQECQSFLEKNKSL